MDTTSQTVVAVTCLFLLLLAFTCIFSLRRSDTWKHLEELRSRFRALVESTRALEALPTRARRAIGAQLGELYEREHSQRLQSTTVRELGPYGASGARFSPLEERGIRTVAQLEAFASPGGLQDIHGIGSTSVELLDLGYRNFMHEVYETRVALLHPREANPEHQNIYRMAAKAVFYKEALEQSVAELREELDSIKLPNVFAFVLKYAEMQHILEEASKALDRLEPRVDSLAKRLDEFCETIDQPAIRESFVLSRREQIQFEINHAVPHDYPAPVFKPIEPTIHDALAASRTEDDFESTVVSRLLDHVGVDYERQYAVQMHFGHAARTVFVDFVIFENDAILSLIENKRQIRSDRALETATKQGLSYAMQLKLTSFAVAAPQGIWLYELPRMTPRLALRIEPEDFERRAGELIARMQDFSNRHRPEAH